MLVTDLLTVGELTFVLRVAIQILAYVGSFIIGIILISTAPRIASAQTHDVFNRIVGKSSATTKTLKWIFNSLRGRNVDPARSPRLLVAFALFILYSLFVSVTDLGFIGFYACTVAGPSRFDQPASVTNQSLAFALVNKNLINGTDMRSIKAYRCEAIEVVQYGDDVSERQCTQWYNSTYADPTLFAGLNTTDSDVLMPVQLKHFSQFRSDIIDLNSFYMGAGSKRIESTSVSDGIVVDPRETGFKAVFGVPNLGKQQTVTLDKAMALEVDIGCIELGMFSQNDPDSYSIGVDEFQVNWKQKYVGPDHLRDVLVKTGQTIRANQRPFYNESTLTSTGIIFSINSTTTGMTTLASVQRWFLTSEYYLNGDVRPETAIMGNCSSDLRTQLGLEVLDESDGATASCGLLSLSGSFAEDGTLYLGLSKMLCATSSQVNMVSATISTDIGGNTTLDITRIPSDLYYTRASYWYVHVSNGTTAFVNFLPYERYTLKDNPASPTSHFITQYTDYSDLRSSGPGSGGTALGRVGTMMVNWFGAPLGENAGLNFLGGGINQLVFNASSVTRSASQVGASFLLQSVAYNGWAAQNSDPILVASTGGRIATCYKLPYALAFVPLLVTAIFVILWGVFILVTSSFGGVKQLEDKYGGFAPMFDAVQASAKGANDLLFFWQKRPEPHLEIVPFGQPIVIRNDDSTALQYLKDGSERY